MTTVLAIETSIFGGNSQSSALVASVLDQLEETRRRETLAADQTLRDAPCDGCLKQVAQQSAVAEPAVPVLRESGVIRHIVGQVQTTEPAVRQIEMHLLAEPALRPDSEAVPHQ